MADEQKPNGHDDTEMETDTPETVDDLSPCEKWDRQRNESPRAFEAFKLWLNSEKRSLTDVARSSNFQCSVANVSRWARVHRWEDRAWAWDLKQEEKQRQQLARDRVNMRARHLKVAMLMQTVASHALLELASKVEQKLPLGMSADEAKALMDSGVKIERATIGPEKHREFTKINVVIGKQRYPGEKCDCGCAACVGCHGYPGDDGMGEAEPPVIDADEPKKLN